MERLFVLTIYVICVFAHSMLVYPEPGGSYCGNLDFQDYDVCFGPCGGTWNRGHVTTLQRGQDIEYKWDRNK